MLAAGQLPQVLKQVLLNPRILKVGRAVAGDLKYLQETLSLSTPFLGAVDLARLAKDRLVVSTARVGLAELVATVLNKRLDKNVSERLSGAWDNDQLPAGHIRYAALDVYACRCVYEKLMEISIPTPLPSTPTLGTPIWLFNTDGSRLLASGTLLRLDGTFDEINITPSRCVVQIQKVLVPGAIISTHKKRTLSDFGDVPFHLVCLRSHLRLESHAFLPSPSQIPLPSTRPTHNSEPPNQLGVSIDEPGDQGSQPGVHSSFVGDIIRDDLTPRSSNSDADTRQYAVDIESQRTGVQVTESVTQQAQSESWSKEIRSRVLKDPFHVFNMFYLPVSHGLRIEFSRALRDTIFIFDGTDKTRIVAWGQRRTPPLSWDALLAQKPDWVLSRCKRIIPPAEILYPLVSDVFQTFGPLKDAKSGAPLFNSAAWAVAKNILELARKGFISDPPDIPLFYQWGVDSETGLPLYKCMRGTNNTEGGVHTHLRSRLPTSGVSVRHVDMCLKDFIGRHNLLVGTLNSTGKKYAGHFSIWLTNDIQELYEFVCDILLEPKRAVTGHVNGNLYQQTDEVSGVLPIPDDIQQKAGMAAYNPALPQATKGSHRYLAARQGTRKAVLPVHNDAERNLFRDLMLGSNSFGDFTSPLRVETAVRIWNATADSDEQISYKVRAQLQLSSTALTAVERCQASRAVECLLQWRLAAKQQYQTNQSCLINCAGSDDEENQRSRTYAIRSSCPSPGDDPAFGWVWLPSPPTSTTSRAKHEH